MAQRIHQHFIKGVKGKYSISSCLEINLLLAKLREVNRPNRPSCPFLDTQLYLKTLSLKILKEKMSKALNLMIPFSSNWCIVQAENAIFQGSMW